MYNQRDLHQANILANLEATESIQGVEGCQKF